MMSQLIEIPKYPPPQSLWKSFQQAKMIQDQFTAKYHTRAQKTSTFPKSTCLMLSSALRKKPNQSGHNHTTPQLHGKMKSSRMKTLHIWSEPIGSQKPRRRHGSCSHDATRSTLQTSGNCYSHFTPLCS